MAVTFATETNARQGFSVANVSMRRGRLDFVASTKALPHEQNEQVRALMRKILAEEFGGTVTHAAKALGISHSIIHEMLSGSRGAGTKVLRAGRATWYPTWFVGAIPAEIVALWP